jgi:trk system potassium uptake protein TrkH
MKKKITPVQTLLMGYIVLTIAGAVLLTFPVSSSQNTSTSFVDALFTAASAISTTGLAVLDTGKYYSTFGQLVILLLIQIGGLGYMIFVAFIAIAAGYRFSLNGKQIFNESIARPGSLEIKKFVKAVVLFTLTFEFIGAVVLTVVFLDRGTLIDSAYSGIFHSISAFCTAGFSLYSDSFMSYSQNLLAHGIVALITIAGGIGFFVLYDLYKFVINRAKGIKPIRLSNHSKLVLSVTFALMFFGTVILFFSESSNSVNFSILHRILNASFQTISASSTTGFNSIDIGSMRAFSLFIIIILMFIGASPGGTGGGIKTSTFGIVVLFLKKVITNRDEVSVFKHTIGETTVNRALAITFISFLYLITIVALLLLTQGFSLLQIAFETASALGTVGLSMGITASLTTSGKLLIILTMIVGRVGPLAIGYSLVGKIKTVKYAFPQGNVMTG